MVAAREQPQDVGRIIMWAASWSRGQDRNAGCAMILQADVGSIMLRV